MTTSHKKITGIFAVSSILVMTLLLAASQVQANPGRDRGYDRADWRLGPHNQILMRTDRGWRRVPGSAIDVGDGWVIGTDRRPGGFGIYRWNGRQFDRVPGGAVEIGGSFQNPWVVNNRGERFEWTGRDWREVRGYGSSWNQSWDQGRDQDRDHSRDQSRRPSQDHRQDHKQDRRHGW